MAEQFDDLSKCEEGGVFGRGGHRVLGRGPDSAGRHPELPGYKECILEVQLGAAPKLGDQEIDRGQETDAEPRLVKEDGGPLAITGGHRNNGPSGDILAEIGEDLALLQEGDKPIKIPHDFGIEVFGLRILSAVGVEGEPTDEQEIELGLGVPDILLELPDEVIKGEG